MLILQSKSHLAILSICFRGQLARVHGCSYGLAALVALVGESGRGPLRAIPLPLLQQILDAAFSLLQAQLPHPATSGPVSFLLPFSNPPLISFFISEMYRLVAECGWFIVASVVSCGSALPSVLSLITNNLKPLFALFKEFFSRKACCCFCIFFPSRILMFVLFSFRLRTLDLALCMT